MDFPGTYCGNTRINKVRNTNIAEDMGSDVNIIKAEMK